MKEIRTPTDPQNNSNNNNNMDIYYSFHGYNNSALSDATDQNESDSEELDMRYSPIDHHQDTTRQSIVIESTLKSTGSYTLDDALKTLQFGKYQYIIICIISVIYFSISLQSKLSNVLYLLIEDDAFVFSIPHDAESLLYIAFGSGGIFGIYLCVFSD